MDTLTLVGALILAGVFGIAGVAKLRDRKGTREAVRAFGSPAVLVSAIALLLPLAELAVAGALLIAATRFAGALGALGLLVLFTGAIAVSLARGKTPECHCFGQLHSEPAGWKTLVRNGLLAALAGLTVAASHAGGTPSAVAWADNLGGVGLLAVALCVTLVAFAVAAVTAFVDLLGSYGKVLVRLEDVEERLAAAGIAEREDVDRAPELGLDPGAPAPGFVAQDEAGASVTLDDLLEPGLPLLLLFTNPACGPCIDLLPEVAAWQDAYADRITIAIATGADDEADEIDATGAPAHGLERVLVDHDLAIYDAFRAAGTPSAVLIAPDGTIASHVAPGSEWIEQLLLGAVVLEAEGAPS